MERTISDLIQGYEKGTLSRRQLVRGLAMLAGGAIAGVGAASADAAQPPAGRGMGMKRIPEPPAAEILAAAKRLGPSDIHATTVNHIAITVKNLDESKMWYQNLFNLQDWHSDPHGAFLGFGESMLVIRPPFRPNQPTGVITHFMMGVDNFNADAMEAELKKYGLNPRKDSDSFHVKDPNGVDVQIGAKDLGHPGHMPK
ncbi:MAG TPA: VOC family protein [Vicinamibacterales bacterium]|nr:VOC family protein [Vicinamibacterales bacterium]